MNLTWSHFGGRRFALAWATLLITSALLWFGKLTDGSYAFVIVSVVGTVVGATTYQQTRTQPPAAPPP